MLKIVLLGNNLKKILVILILISISSILFFDDSINNYAPLLLMVSYPIFYFHYFTLMGKFSDALKKEDIVLFQANEITFGYFKGERIQLINLFGNPAFEKITNSKTLALYIKTKEAIIVTFSSFIASLILGILTVYY